MQPRPTCPRVSAGVFSSLFFIWVYPLLFKGRKKILDLDDIYETLPDDLSKDLGDRLSFEWDKEVEKYGYTSKLKESNPSKRPSLLRALTRIFFKKFAVTGILLALEECAAKIGQPLCLGLLLRYLNTKTDSTQTNGYLYAAGVVLCTMYFVASHHPTFFSLHHLNLKVRIASSVLVYRKTLKLSQLALEETTAGQLVNILSNDVSRFDQGLSYIHYLWIGPVQLALILWILYGYFGESCFCGAFFVAVFTFQSIMGHYFGKLRSKVAQKTDKRVRIMNEILNGIRVIKMYGWEDSFSKTVGKLREDEIKTIGRTLMLRAVNLSLYYVSSKFVVFLTLMTYALLGNTLTSEKVFVAVALYQNLRQIMATYFPLGISSLAETLVSIKRIEDFLMLEDYKIPEMKSPEIMDEDIDSDKKSEVSLKNVVAQWMPDYIDLDDITFKVSEGELLAVIGSVGSGKSSLLQVILQELPTLSGELAVKGTIAYAPQEPWVFSGTIRDNIIFNSEYEALWYQSVVDACGLNKDFHLFAYGDKTFVGGQTLSGGQKARISLARAIYSDADIYLLDDPLSAVDAEIGRHLFEKCIRGIIKHKVIILVTHQVQFLPDVTEILLLSNGKTLAQGNYSDLQKNDASFAHIVENISLKPKKLLENDKCSRPEILKEMSRTGSIGSIHSVEDETIDDIFMDSMEEDRCVGTIGARVYWKYISIGSNCGILLALFLSNVLTQILFTGSDYWLQIWIKAEENSYKEDSQYNANVDNFLKFILPGLEIKREFIVFYAILIGALFTMTLLRTFGFFSVSMNSSVALHSQLFRGILRAPMLFFDRNPIGRILNRFTKDMQVVDELLPLTLFDTLELTLQVLGVVILISIINPYFLIPSLLIGVMFVTVRNFYQKTARNLKRLEGVARSPVYSHLSASISGLSTIRAYRAQDQFIREFEEHLDLHTSTYYLFISSARWLGIVVDWIAILYTSSVTFGVLVLGLDAATGGLAISSALSLTRLLQWGVRQSAEAENQMVSVERVLQYTDIESEAALESSKDRKPPSSWPSTGEIVMDNISVRYGSDAPVLKNISCTIHPLEKVGIVGRTGAGKTSFISAIFRLTEPCNGILYIDGINVLKIGLHDLRSKISIIPQDPTLFVGTLRQNFDPLMEYSDAEVWDVLKDVNLFEMVKEHSTGLDSMVTEGGSNISVGQKQLICMGRAILRRSKILVMDEATANVDPETDNLIQNTIRTKFLQCTVLTIAHRLNTVIDSDRIIVLDAGKLKEFDEPYKLLQDQSSIFYHLVQETGKDSAEVLTNAAKVKSESKNQSNSKGDGPTNLKNNSQAKGIDVLK